MSSTIAVICYSLTRENKSQSPFHETQAKKHSKAARESTRSKKMSDEDENVGENHGYCLFGMLSMSFQMMRGQSSAF